MDRWLRTWRCWVSSSTGVWSSIVARSCNYRAQAIRHIRYLLTTELAQTLACNLILSRIDYCNAVLHGAPTGTIQKLQRVQNNAARIVLQAPRWFHAKPLLHHLHWLPVQQRITYKLAKISDIQSSEHVHSGLSTPPNRRIHLHPYVPLPFRCWTNSMLSGLQHWLSGTRCHKQFSSVILWLFFFFNLDLKLFCSISLLLNIDPTCRQHLWSYDHMAL